MTFDMYTRRDLESQRETHDMQAAIQEQEKDIEAMGLEMVAQDALVDYLQKRGDSWRLMAFIFGVSFGVTIVTVFIAAVIL